MDKMAVVKALLCDGPASPTCSDNPWRVGEKYFIRTVTNYWTGRLVSVGPVELVIEDAAWIADTGRFHDSNAKGTLNEVEPVDGPVIIGRATVIDASVWKHALPRSQK